MNIQGYTVEREIGHGGMSTVYLALQESLDRQVALKVMAPALAADRSFGERFLKEARTVAKLSHPNILGIYDIGQSGHYYYMTIEYVAGGDLKQRIRQGAMAPTQALQIVRQVAEALGYAHDKGFVHRDVKPENVLFRDDGSVVLADFGIAKAVGSGTRMTGTGMSIGTPHYMSPEQARGKDVDGRSDLYSLGVVLFEMLTGCVPYDSQDSFAVGLAHINDPVPQLPDHLVAYQSIIDHLMAKEPKSRFADASELINSLQPETSPGQAINKTVSSSGTSPTAKTVVMPEVRSIEKDEIASRPQFVHFDDSTQNKASNSKPPKESVFPGVVAVVIVIVVVWIIAATSGRSNNSRAATPLYKGKDNRSFVDSTQSKRINILLADAEQNLAALRLMNPQGDNALEKYKQVLVLESSNQEALRGVQRVAEKYLELARQKLAAGDLSKGSLYIDNAAKIEPRLSGISSLRNELARLVSAAEKRKVKESKESINIESSVENNREHIIRNKLLRFYDFEEDSLNVFPSRWANGPWSDAGTNTVQRNPTISGNKSLKVTSKRSNQKGLYAPGSLFQGDHSLAMDVYLPAGGESGYYFGGFDYAGFSVFFKYNSSGVADIYAWSSGVSPVKISSITTEKWHKIKADIRWSASTYDFYVDSTRYGSNLSFSKKATGGWSSDLSLRGDNNQGIRTVYVDNVSLTTFD